MNAVVASSAGSGSMRFGVSTCRSCSAAVMSPPSVPAHVDDQPVSRQIRQQSTELRHERLGARDVERVDTDVSELPFPRVDARRLEDARQTRRHVPLPQRDRAATHARRQRSRWRAGDEGRCIQHPACLVDQVGLDIKTEERGPSERSRIGLVEVQHRGPYVANEPRAANLALQALLVAIGQRDPFLIGRQRAHQRS